jgi:hypothetical protein
MLASNKSDIKSYCTVGAPFKTTPVVGSTGGRGPGADVELLGPKKQEVVCSDSPGT